MTKSIRRVRKTDYDRVVLTETCPYEVPIIFENIGVYNLLKANSGEREVEHGITRSFLAIVLGKKRTDFTVPFSYKIRKDSFSFREVSLLHPASQLEVVEFYKEFQHKIINVCSVSDFSIRAPKKIAGKYYQPNNSQLTNEFKSDKMVDSKNENLYKHLTSYFSYGGHRRLYNFFDSAEFMMLERKYSNFWALDINKCFDSIYTESINWSVHEKDFFKINSGVGNTFGSVFTKLMESANYNDSSGILIGPEVSRIFAEVIFQRIDRNVKESLAARKIMQGVDYDIRRYVDDIYLFATGDEIARIVFAVIEEKVKEYKLSLNHSKTIKVGRPFVTKQTQTMMEIKSRFKTLERQLVEKEKGELKFAPKRLIKRKYLVVSFVNEIKSLCFDDPSSYTMACNFLIKAIANLIVKFCRKNIKRQLDEAVAARYSSFFLVVIEFVFHFYTVNPSHSGAVQLCKITEFIVRFCDKKFKDESPLIKGQIHRRCLEFFESSEFAKLSRQYSDSASIEILNILIVSSCLGKDYGLTESELVSSLQLEGNRQLGYFEILVLLYYIGRRKKFSLVYAKVIDSLRRYLLDLSDIKSSAQKAYIFFEAISCPYVPYDEKLKFASLALQAVGGSNEPSLGYDAILLVQDLECIKFCGSWDKAAMMSLLEKKALQKVY